MKIIETIYDITTGETLITERDETTEETNARLAREEKFAEITAAEAAKAAEKEALLARLGITADEAKLLLA